MQPKPLPYPLRTILDLVFPPRCQGCGRFGPEVLCGACRQAIRRIVPPFCLRCGVPFDPLAQGGPLCAACRRRRRFPYTWSRSAAVYGGVLREAVHNYKFARRRVLAWPLAELMLEAIAAWQKAGLPDSDPAQWDLLCPVPLHPRRLRARGFNQSLLLCHRLSQALGVPVTEPLRRVRETLPQQQLPGEARPENVREAFAAETAAVAGRRVVLVDDLWTTGSTLVQCARALRGARAVYLFSLSRPLLGATPALSLPAR